MKNKSFSPVLFALVCLVFILENCKDNCENDVSIDAVQPYSSPAGYEVLLKTSGLSDSAKVFFGLVEADSKPGGQAGEIVATVPNGLLGNVEVSVEDGDCIGRSDEFVVSGSLPLNIPPSFQQIIVSPPGVFNDPNGNFTNVWENAVPNSTHKVFISGSLVDGVGQLDEPASNEQDSNNPYFDGNLVKGTIDNNTNKVYLEIDRSAKDGGFIEHYDGSLIIRPDFLPATNNNDIPAILLVSRETGRQMLLYFP